MSDYEKLTDRELSELIAERLMDWSLIKRHAHESIWKTPSIDATTLTMFAASDNAARLVRDRIKELGLVKKYMVGVAHQAWPVGTPASTFKGADDFSFMMHNATPRQQCIAALEAVKTRIPTPDELEAK